MFIFGFWQSIATFFNKMEEGCVAALMRRWQHVVIASVMSSDNTAQI
jgi:hypothetical protein